MKRVLGVLTLILFSTGMRCPDTSPCTLSGRGSIEDGAYLEFVWYDENRNEQNTILRTPMREVKISCGDSDIQVLREMVTHEVVVCLIDTCPRVVNIALEGGNAVVNDTAEGYAGTHDNFYLEIYRRDGKLYIRGLKVGNQRVLVSPKLYTSLAPRSDYQEEVEVVVSERRGAGHALWFDRDPFEDIEYDDFGKLKVLQDWGDSVLVGISFRQYDDIRMGLRWIEGG